MLPSTTFTTAFSTSAFSSYTQLTSTQNYMHRRQNWRQPSSSTTKVPTTCTPYTLPSGLIIPYGPSWTITLPGPATVTPECYTNLPAQPTSTDSTSASDVRDPFYASTIPLAYSIAATTTLAYILLLLLFVPNPPNRRPWLQKIATLTVVVCLTIAFAETTAVLSDEYRKLGSSVYSMVNEARTVRSRVSGGMVLKVGRIISNLFLWLAMVQTLMRLFPRTREKAVIKWGGFGMIIFDTIFSILQTFVSPLASGTDSFLDAIPALGYLFQISLSLLYACSVIFYSLSKRRFSYFFPHRPFARQASGSRKYGGRSIILIATLSIASVITPIVFFIVDIAQKDLAGWGDYIRWVGAAAASVVVWEWVDRIEGLEREAGKGGVLGREVFEEDEVFGNEWGDGRANYHRLAAQLEREQMQERTTVTDPSADGTASTDYNVNMRQLPTMEVHYPPPAAVVEHQSSVSADNFDAPPTPPRPPPPPPPPAPTEPRDPPRWVQFVRRLGRWKSSSADLNVEKTEGSTHTEDRERVEVERRRRLPVTVIPAPPRGRRGSMGAVERARRAAILGRNVDWDGSGRGSGDGGLRR